LVDDFLPLLSTAIAEAALDGPVEVAIEEVEFVAAKACLVH